MAHQRSYAKFVHAFLFLVALGLSSNLLAQAPHCHADEMLSEYMISAGMEHEMKAYKQHIKENTQYRTGGVVVDLPVVFHVIHHGQVIGSGPNLTNAKIIEQLDLLNQDFAFQNSDRSLIPSQFAAVAIDTEIQFCLASRDANGQATSGIVRHEMPTINSVNNIENSVKPQTQWDPNRYINIWIVQLPDPSLLGYAYLPIPSIVGTARDGIVISHLKVGNQGNLTRGRTLVHEMGHYLGLLHMWGFEEEDCTEDDQISDTPSAFAPYYSCPVYPQFTCGTSDMFMNYMDYVNDNCMFMFSEGQKNIMQAVINNQRSSVRNNTNTACNNTVSIADDIIESDALTLFPNPCEDHINMELDAEYQVNMIRIYDMSGKLMYHNPANSPMINGGLQINTSGLGVGVYLVRILMDTGETLTKRFVRANP